MFSCYSHETQEWLTAICDLLRLEFKLEKVKSFNVIVPLSYNIR